MKIKFLRFVLFISFIFFLGPLCAKADFGDVRYDITNVSLSGSNITFKGWAFIHKTNNYDEVESAGLTNGDQKILIRAVKEGGGVIETKVTTGSSAINYNFYCELFAVAPGKECVETNYINPTFNQCDDGDYNYCYYEDMYFSITFDTSSSVWASVTEHDEIKFEIAVSNADFESERGSYSGEIEYNGDYFTRPVDVYVASASVGNSFNDFIIIDVSSLSMNVNFIATHGYLYKVESYNDFFKYDNGCPYGDGCCAYGEYRDPYTLFNRTYSLISLANYQNGRSNAPSEDRCKSFLNTLGSTCKGTYYYALSVSSVGDIGVQDLIDGGNHCKTVATPGSGAIAIARGSHIQLTGSTSFRINISRDNLCPVVENPSSGALTCNGSNTFNSTCDELTVHTGVGSADVKIEQTGTISSVLTPSKTFAGGGFNFGVLYQNSIKWSYVGTAPNSTLHNEVKDVMNSKIKNYDTYIAGLNIAELKIGDVSYGTGFLEKKCYTLASPTSNKDYYNNELTVSCVFTFPEATLSYNGDVGYTTVGNAIDINNKYYTPINYNGEYKIEAKITGMSRITDGAAISDSEQSGVPWTGNWEDTFEDCKIDIYPLFYKDNPPPGSGSKYNFIYRPIDLNNPFPNRNAGINWYDWYNDTLNKADLEDAYSELEYTTVLDNQTVSDIKTYNQGKNYLSWDSIDNNGKSSFVDSYVIRESGS